MSAITTHVLDTAKGVPAKGIVISLESLQGERWEKLARGETNNDGRLLNILPKSRVLEKGTYRLTFMVGDYFANLGLKSFYHEIPIVFKIDNPDQHYHVPLLLNPFGYSTYRGS